MYLFCTFYVFVFFGEKQANYFTGRGKPLFLLMKRSLLGKTEKYLSWHKNGLVQKVLLKALFLALWNASPAFSLFLEFLKKRRT